MFAINNLSTLLSSDSNDGISSIRSENVFSNVNGGDADDSEDCGIVDKIEIANKSTAAIERDGETEMLSQTQKVSLDGKKDDDDEDDDESTEALSESSSSSHMYSMFGRPIKEVVPPSPTNGNTYRNKDSVLISSSQGEEDKNEEGARSASKNEGDSIMVLSDVEEGQYLMMDMQDPALISSEERRGTGIEDLATPSTITNETEATKGKEKDCADTEAEGGFNIDAKDGENPPLTLAQRMKEMFDSKSPDQPSNAFGKSIGRPLKSSLVDSGMPGSSERNSQKPASLAKDMKAMFDSPSPVELSRAFGTGKITVQNPKQSITRGTKQPKCDTASLLTKESNLASPVSVADQKVSLMWASSSGSTRTFPLLSIDPKYKAPVKQRTKENLETSLVMIRDIAIIEEEEEEVIDGDDDDVIEGITVNETVDHDDALVMVCDDGSVVEIIEEVIIDNEFSQDGMSVTIVDEFSQIKSRIELSPGFVETVETGECDECSYDEITAGDSEYDEKTVDDNSDADALHEDQDDDIESKERVGKKGGTNTNTLVLINNNKELLDSLHPSITATNKKLDFQTKRSVVRVQNEKGRPSAISYIPAPSLAKETQTYSTPTKILDNHRKDSPPVKKINPQLQRDRSSTGKITEKLKMFDSPHGIARGQKQAITFQQLRRKPKPRIESSPYEPNKVATKVKGENPEKTGVLSIDEPRAKQVDKLDAKPLNVSGYTREDEVLVEEIISLVKEPGAMQNKYALAERITFLLKYKNKKLEVPTSNCSLPMSLSKLAERPFPKTNYAVEVNAYSGRPNYSSYSTPKKIFEGHSLKMKQAIVEVNGFSSRTNSPMLAAPSKLFEDSSSHKSKHVVEARSYFGRPNCSLYITPKKLFEDPSPKHQQAIESNAYSSQSTLSSSSKLLKDTSQKSKHVVEAYAFMNHRKDGFQDLGLKQMRTDAEIQKGNLHYIEDPNTTQNRHIKQINTKERKEDMSKLSSLKQDPDKMEEVVDAEAIIGQIWPKTPEGEKQKPKASRSSSRASKKVTFERQRPAPRKLEEKLKMFENTPSSRISPSKPPGTFEMDGQPRTVDDKIARTMVAAQNGKNDKNTKSNQISKQTVMMILSFQRLWRARRKLKSKTTIQTEVRSTWKKEVAFAKTKISFPGSQKGKTSSSTGTRNQFIPTLSDNVDISVPTSCPDPESIVPSNTRSSIDSDVGCSYSLEDFEQGRFDPSVVDMERWEEFLSDESFNEHFGLTRDYFFKQPKWKRDMQKRKVRNAF